MSIKTTDPLQAAIAALEKHGCQPKRSGDGWAALCPIHEADGNPHKPSLTVNAGIDQPLLMSCKAGCDFNSIRDALGLPRSSSGRKGEVVAEYTYRDAEGREVRQKVRYEPKGFSIRHWNSTTREWVNRGGDGPAVLYRLPELKAAIAEGSAVFVVEGEKDADRLAGLGLAATTAIDGANPNAWKPPYTEQLEGAGRVVLLPDNDAPGRSYMNDVALKLAGKVGEVRILKLPGLPAKGDVSDWLKAGHTVEELQALVEETPVDDGRPKPDARQLWLDGFAYLPAEDRYLEIASGNILRPAGFRLLAERVSPGAWKGENACLAFARGQGLFIDGEDYVPGGPPVLRDRDTVAGAEYVRINLWRPPKLPEPVYNAGDEAAFIDFVRYLCGGDVESTEVLLDWMANLVQRPDRRAHWLPLMISPAKGVGKGVLVQTLTAILGPHNVGVVGTDAIGGTFHDGLTFKQLVVIDEFRQFENANAKLNAFKSLLTDPRVPCNRKNRPQITVRNTANFFATSNYETAASIDSDERRYFVVMSYSPPREQAYYSELCNRFLPSSGGSVSGLLWMLQHRDLSGFNPCGRAPETDGKRAMLEAGKSHALQVLSWAKDNRSGIFAADLIPAPMLRLALRQAEMQADFNAKMPGPHAVDRCRDALRLEHIGRRRIAEGSDTKTAIYCVRDAERWRKASESEIREHLALHRVAQEKALMR